MYVLSPLLCGTDQGYPVIVPEWTQVGVFWCTITNRFLSESYNPPKNPVLTQELPHESFSLPFTEPPWEAGGSWPVWVNPFYQTILRWHCGWSRTCCWSFRAWTVRHSYTQEDIPFWGIRLSGLICEGEVEEGEGGPLWTMIIHILQEWQLMHGLLASLCELPLHSQNVQNLWPVTVSLFIRYCLKVFSFYKTFFFFFEFNSSYNT